MPAAKILACKRRERLSSTFTGAGRRWYFIWELFSHYPLNSANSYWRLSRGLRSAHAIEPSSIRPAHGNSEQHLYAQFNTRSRSARRVFSPWKQLDD